MEFVMPIWEDEREYEGLPMPTAPKTVDNSFDKPSSLNIHAENFASSEVLMNVLEKPSVTNDAPICD